MARRYTEIYYIRTKLAGAILPSRLTTSGRKIVSNTLTFDFTILSIYLSIDEILWIGGVLSPIGGKIRPKIRL